MNNRPSLGSNRQTENADQINDLPVGLASAGAKAGASGSRRLRVQTRYAGRPSATIPKPIAALFGVETITFSTRAAAAKMNRSGVQGYPGTR